VEDVARRGHRVERPGGDPAAVTLLPDDAEVAELEAIAVAHEDIERREIAVEHLSAMEFAEHLEHARDLTPSVPFGEAFARALKECAQIAVRRVLEDEAVQHLTRTAVAQQRKHVIDANGARVVAQLLPEVRFAEPAVDVRARLDAHGFGDVGRAPQPASQIDLTEPAFTEQ